MKHKTSQPFLLHKHSVISCAIAKGGALRETKGWPKAGRSSAPAFFKGFGITANVSGVCVVKMGIPLKFAMKNGFFVFKAEGRENIIK